MTINIEQLEAELQNLTGRLAPGEMPPAEMTKGSIQVWIPPLTLFRLVQVIHLAAVHPKIPAKIREDVLTLAAEISQTFPQSYTMVHAALGASWATVAQVLNKQKQGPGETEGEKSA